MIRDREGPGLGCLSLRYSNEQRAGRLIGASRISNSSEPSFAIAQPRGTPLTQPHWIERVDDDLLPASGIARSDSCRPARDENDGE